MEITTILMSHKCRICGVKLTEENWYPSYRKSGDHRCKKCSAEQVRLWRKANPDKAKVIQDNAREYRAKWQKANPDKVQAYSKRAKRKRGHRPFNENKECPMFLGIHIAERVLSHVFKNVERMPILNAGYDVICNHGKLIDIKSACARKDGKGWVFHINRNTIADFFLCLAFDTREDLNPLHAWLIPGSKLNHLTGAGISPGTIHKWDEHRLDTVNIEDCCNTIR